MDEHGDAPQHDRDDEDARERYRELLEEVRTIMPGAQVLLGFLLTVPFANRLADVDRLGRILFVVALAATAASTGLVLLAVAITIGAAEPPPRATGVRSSW